MKCQEYFFHQENLVLIMLFQLNKDTRLISVIHTPSNDQLSTCTRMEPPPAYETIMMAEIGSEDGPIIMTSPPNYNDISGPIPKYGDPM